MASTNIIALSPLASAPASTATTNTAPTNSQPLPSTTVQTPNIQTPQSAAATSQNTPGTALPQASGQSGSINNANDNSSVQSSLCLWIQKFKPFLNGLLSITKFAVATLGVFWALKIAIAGLDLQRWSARNDSLQSCLALDSRSSYCNATIAAGVQPPPKTKREAEEHGASALTAPLLLLMDKPFMLAATVVLTLTTIVVSTIYFRSRMEPFRPVISRARNWIPIHAGGTKWTRPTCWTAIGTVQLYWVATGVTQLSEYFFTSPGSRIRLDRPQEHPDSAGEIGAGDDENVVQPNGNSYESDEETEVDACVPKRPVPLHEHVARAVHETLRDLGTHYPVADTAPDRRKDIILANLEAASLYKLLVCFCRILSFAPECLLLALRACGEEDWCTERETMELRTMSRLSMPMLFAMVRDVVDELDERDDVAKGGYCLTEHGLRDEVSQESLTIGLIWLYVLSSKG